MHAPYFFLTVPFHFLQRCQHGCFRLTLTPHGTGRRPTLSNRHSFHHHMGIGPAKTKGTDASQCSHILLKLSGFGGHGNRHRLQCNMRIALLKVNGRRYLSMLEGECRLDDTSHTCTGFGMSNVRFGTPNQSVISSISPSDSQNSRSCSGFNGISQSRPGSMQLQILQITRIDSGLCVGCQQTLLLGNHTGGS